MDDVKKEVKRMADPERAKANAWFFKTGVGQYGEGDKFIGLTVPKCREVAKKFSNLELGEIQKLLDSEIHEERLIALFILVEQFKKADKYKQKLIYQFYLKNAKRVNNWDLVDSSAAHIVGAYLADKNRKILYKLASSKNLWERRIAIIATFYFIRFRKENEDTFKIAEILMNDEQALSREARKKHDLIHKAVGWMLRETGKNVSEKEEVDFLKVHYKTMPRTMLRYAIERLEPNLKTKFMKGEI